MHPRVYKEFERICSERSVQGSVLEVGATISDESLLCMKSLEHVSEKIGIDLNGPYDFKGFKILKGNANDMDCFPDNRFDAVLCSSVLEHDKYFWKTLSEIKRVTKPGGLIALGVPGYTKLRAEKVKGLWARMPLIRRLQNHEYLNGLFMSTITFQVHSWPGDYYRFSPQSMREVFLEGLEQIDVRAIMWPPRIIGCGTKPAIH